MPNVPEPFAGGLLEVESGVQIYWEQSGNPAGEPVLYLHGGPGSGLGGGGWRQIYLTGRTCVIALDQRGCGRSRPLVSDAPATLATNTTQTLICDVEALREHLGIERWLVSGISWGTTLALAYALAHPQRVMGLALAAVTTTCREEVDWLTEDMGRIFPEQWDRFAASAHRLPGERIVAAYARRLASGDAEDRAAAALAWDSWENTHLSLAPGRRERALLHEDPLERLLFSTLVTHYWANGAFLPGAQAILARVGELTGIPLAMVHGRHDISGPVITPWKIHRALPDSTLMVVEDAGHGGSGIYESLRQAVTTML
jgi:proline iminopeptidase